MHRFVVLDTETSGLFDFAKPADDPSQPRLASISLIYPSADLSVVDREFTRLIKPDGWLLSDEAAAVNGLTMERLEAEGVPVSEALDEYEAAVRGGHVIAAFHAQYDCKVMRSEFRRAGRDDLFMLTHNTCLMRGSQKLGVEKAGSGRGFPKLSDVLRHIGVEHEGAHTSRGDALGAFYVLRHLVNENALIEPGVHLKKASDAPKAPRPRKSNAPVGAGDEIPN